MNLLRRWDSGPYVRAFSLNSPAIRLERAHICPRSPIASRRFPKSDRLLVNVNIDQRGNTPPPMAYAGRAMAMKADVASAALEAGTQSIEVAVNGTIELAP